MAFFIDFKILKYSIVNTLEDVEFKKDSQEPYELIDFVKNLDIDNIGNEFIVDSYNKYLIEWTKIKNQTVEDFDTVRKNKYIQLLQNIQLNYLTQDEERILGNIDFTNDMELEVAIPFFVEKIKDIIEYFIKKRRDVKNSKVKWSTKGSKQFLESFIAQYIIDNYTKNPNTFQRFKQDFQNVSDFQNQFRLEYDGLYDLNDYRKQEFTFDPKLFLSSSSDYVLSSLPITSFSDYNRDGSTLIDELKKELYQKYISVDYSYYNDGVSTEIKSVTPFFDPYNYETPFISRISDTTNLLRDKDIGYYFTSKYIYTSNYFSPFGISLLDTSELTQLLPKINIYRSEDYKDYFLWSKYGNINQGLYGKPVTNPRLKRFYGYQSRDLNLNESVGGVERYTDNIQLWSGSKHETWANEDVFDKFKDNILNRDEKNEFFFTLSSDESLHKYVCDIFGNQYYMIKTINTVDTSSDFIYTLRESVIGDSESINNFSLLGQRPEATSGLDAISIADNVVLGFFISTASLSSTTITDIEDYNIYDKSYYNLITDKFDTSQLSSSSFDNLKSIYENQYSVGKVYVRDANSSTIKSLSTFLSTSDTIADDIGQNIIDIDIVNDVIIITTNTNIYTGKITYNFSTNRLTINNLSRSVTTFNNTKLNKTSSLWFHTKDNLVYFANVDHGNDTYSIYKIDINTSEVSLFNIDDSEIDYNYENTIEFKIISKPQIIKKGNFIYLVLLISDTCKNYYYQIIKYDIISKTTLKAIYNNIYHPSNLKITSDIIGDPFAALNPSLSSFELSSFTSEKIFYYNNTELVVEEYTIPTLSSLSSISEDHYDNDESGVVTIEKPHVSYNLSDLVNGITPDINTTTTEDTYIYSGGTIYTPVDISIDFTNIDNFNSYISTTEPIYKIEYYVNGGIKTQYILDNNQVDVDNIYNTQFQTSPINMEAFSFKNKVLNFSVIFYSLSGKKYRFEFEFEGLNFALSEKYNKIELLDIRIKDTATGQKDCILYLNTRKPDSIITTSILNI